MTVVSDNITYLSTFEGFSWRTVIQPECGGLNIRICGFCFKKVHPYDYRDKCEMKTNLNNIRQKCSWRHWQQNCGNKCEIYSL